MAKPHWCLAQHACGSWLCAALPETSAAGGSEPGPADVLTLTPVTSRKDKKNFEEAATCFLHLELGDGAGGRERDGTPQNCSFKAVFVAVPLLECYCYQKEINSA